MKKKKRLDVTYDWRLTHKLYNLGFSFPKVNVVANNKKFTKIKTAIRQNIIM